jgi:tRNA(Arg) A34 adenosine deaminase TadA
MKKSLLKLALNIAKAKVDNHTEYWRHYTFIVQDNKIVSWSPNQDSDPPVHYGYKARFKRMDAGYRPKIHSEIACYRKAKGILDRKPFEIINIRLNKHKVMRLSKPCICCYSLLQELGCSKFYYSSDYGFQVA